VVCGAATPTNVQLVNALGRCGYRAELAVPGSALEARPGDLVLGRLDVLETLDGIEHGLGALGRLQREAGRSVNGPLPLLTAHDKLLTASTLAGTGIRHPSTVHVHDGRIPLWLEPPFVVKPRFGSWGRDVFRCESAAGLRRLIRELEDRSWFQRQGALVQELVGGGRDLRVVVAGGRVVGAVERVAPPGEWRTNVALGGVRRPFAPGPEARVTALRAAVALDLDLCGVDLAVDGRGRHVVLEVNGAVDFTTAYGLGRDPFDAVADALVADAALDASLAA
jgi:RimK family alpha-L-glutamate ligase